jgi:hypothetical protein
VTLGDSAALVAAMRPGALMTYSYDDTPLEFAHANQEQAIDNSPH